MPDPNPHALQLWDGFEQLISALVALSCNTRTVATVPPHVRAA
jgi:hypothetical protein